MLLDFSDKALEDFYTKGSMRGMNPALAPRVRKCLKMLERSSTQTFIALPGTHKLRRGKACGSWAMKVSGAWRICFRPKRNQFSDVLLTQYH